MALNNEECMYSIYNYFLCDLSVSGAFGGEPACGTFIQIDYYAVFSDTFFVGCETVFAT